MNSDPTLTPLPVVFESLLLILEAVSLFAVLFLVYAAHLYIREKRDQGSPVKSLGGPIGHALAFIVIVIGFLMLAHERVWFGHPSHVPAVLGAALIVCAIYYFAIIRGHWEDDRIRYGMLIWTALWILTGLLLGFIYWISTVGGGFRLDHVDGAAFSQYVNSFAQIIGIIIAATMVIVTNRHNAENADDTQRQLIYQTLELESVRLFRFECEHPELVARLWYPERPALPETMRYPEEVREFQLREYICQILNLFEMACRFRSQRIFEAEVFKSWVIWMWELCNEKAFQVQWKQKELNLNYVERLREIIDAGIHFATGCPAGAGAADSLAQTPTISPSDRRRAFFRYVGRVLNDEAYVELWLDRSATDASKFEEFWPKSAQPV
jgi:hypothetical protein